MSFLDVRWPRLPFLRKRLSPGITAAHAAIAAGKTRKPKTKAVLIKEMADAWYDAVLRRGKKLTREEKLQLLDDNMLDAALAISQRLAKIRDEEDFPLTDTMQMFKQVSEYRMKEARVSKIDPKTRDETDGTPSGIRQMQEKLAQDKQDMAEQAPPERTNRFGQRDGRLDNPGRPPGEGLKKKQERVRAQMEKLREAEAAQEPQTPTGEV